MATDRRIASSRIHRLDVRHCGRSIGRLDRGWAVYLYTVHNWVGTPQQLLENLPFSIYILSPAIASYGVLRYRGRVSGPREWLEPCSMYALAQSYMPMSCWC